MDPQGPDSLTNMVKANDKLLKALISLLALKDEHLLEELQIVFAIASREHSPIAQASAQTWAHVHKELDLIADLVASEDDHADKAAPTALAS